MFFDFILYFSIIFIHECGHAFMGRIYKWKINKICIYPFGGVSKFDEDINKPISEEGMILVMGPFVQFVFLLFSLFFFKNTFFYTKILTYNLLLLIFNLLPIYPLDGGRILNLVFNKRNSYLKSFTFSFSLSFFLLFLLLLLSIYFQVFVSFLSIFSFLFFLVYQEWRKRKYYFNKFKLERFLHTYPFSKVKCVRRDKDMMRDKKHVFFLKGHYVSEKEYLKKMYKNYK